MRIGTFATTDGGPWRAGALLGDDRVLDLAAALGALPRRPDQVDAKGLYSPVDAMFWLDPAGQDMARRLLAEATQAPPAGAVHVLEAVTLGPPHPRPGKFIAIGRNYMNHVKEGQQLWAARGKTVDLPTFPAAFAKFPSALAGPEAAIVLPHQVPSVDYEIELAFVIGREAFCVREEDALSYVAGYTVCNDVGARDLQRLEMEAQIGITKSKNFPTFAPMGPWIVTADEIPDPQALTLELKVNGQQRQHASTQDMIFSVAKIIAYWSRIGLQPGDMFTTGTPSGVALARPQPQQYYLREGDVVEAWISGIGRLANRVVSAPAA